MTRIPMRRLRFGGDAWLDVDGDHVDVNVPRLLTRTWRLPIDGMALLRAIDERGAPTDRHSLHYDPPLRFANLAAQMATTILLFDEPRRIVPLKMGADTVLANTRPRQTRDPGAWVDGVILGLEEPIPGHAALVDAGLPLVEHRDDWFSGRRDLLTEAVAAGRAARRRLRRWAVALLVLAWLLLVLLLALLSHDDPERWGATATLTFLIPLFAIQWRHRR